MKIRIRDIKVEGLKLEESLLPENIGLAAEDYLKFKGPISVNAFAEKVDNTLLVKLNIKGEFDSFCARCLEPLHDSWNKELLLDFAVDKTIEYIDLDDDIRQEMLLSVPAKLLCKDDCKGLCVGCGVNLNLEKCKCNKK